MKTLKKNWFSFGLTIWLLSGVLTANAANPTEKKDLERIYDLESFYSLDNMVKEIEDLLSESGRIEIIDSNDQLVAEGTKNNDEIKNYMGISDLLTEIDGIQYYRLSYQ